MKRRRVDALRVTLERLQRELEALERTAGRRSPLTVEAMRQERDRTRDALRAASRDLVASTR